MRQIWRTALLPLIVGLSVPCLGQATDPRAEPRQGAKVHSTPQATLDPALVALEHHLSQLLRGELPAEVSVENLFGVALGQPAELADRIDQLTKQTSASAAAIAQMRERLARPPLEPTAVQSPVDGSTTAGDPAGAPPPAAGETQAARTRLEQEVAAAVLRSSVAHKRLEYLGLLRERLSKMTDASRRILPALAQPRAGLRRHAGAVAELGSAIDRLGVRLDDLAGRSERGSLVGFLPAQRSLATDLRAGAAAHRDQSERLAALAAEQRDLAASAEARGQQARAAFFRSVAHPGGQAALDEAFRHHLATQRDLAKRARDTVTAPGLDQVEALLEQAERTAAAPDQIGTTDDGHRIADAATEHRQAIEALIAAERAGATGWSLAFENEIVTVLADQASPEARAQAYTRSNEVLQDVSSELRLARDRVSEGFARQREATPTPAELLGTAAGRSLLTRSALIGGIFLLWLWLRGRAPRITVSLVRGLARLPMFKGRVGTLVRWSGLIQSVLPTLTGLAALRLGLALLEEGPVRQIVGALAMPMVLYFLGRQFIGGATRRLTRGRPPLIELTASTLARVQRTYASLGLVVAFATMLDGVARIAIGTGRVVTLLGRAMLVWVAIWAIWEAILWRVPLARSCADLTRPGDDAPPNLEHRVATWMEGHWAGFFLSPFALLRVVGTPVFEWFRALARETNLVQSFRSWRLRRRSTPDSDAAVSARPALPEAYLDAFPLHPILGEDTSQLIPRDETLDEIVEQLNSWRGSRADGSIVVTGEKGIGKTTLAAQVSRRIREIEVVQHTIRGKPTTREELAATLGDALGTGSGGDLNTLAAALREGPERVVVLDEVHNVFLRCVDGYAAYDALVELVNETSRNVFWVLIFNAFTWQFLNEARNRIHYFRKLLSVPSWTPDELQALIKLRNRQTGFDLLFDEVLLSDEKVGSERIELVEEADGYFRLLWESSGGNPRIATRLWLSSLTPVDETTLRVGIFREPSVSALSSLADDLLFSLAAVCQHENLSAPELSRVLNLSPGFGRFAIQFLSESGFLEPKDASGERFTLAPASYRGVLRVLRSKHLLFD